MKKWAVVIFEDHRKYAQLLADTIPAYFPELDIVMHTDNLNHIQELIQTAEGPYIFLLDIMIGNLPQGLEAGHMINAARIKHKTIYLTYYPDKLLFEVLLKIKATNIILKSKKALKELHTTLHMTINDLNGKNLLIYSDASRYIAASLEGIVMIESDADNKAKGTKKIIIYHIQGCYTINHTLSGVLGELTEKFYRCHNTYIVNVDHVVYLKTETKEILLTDGLKCKYSYGKGKPLLQALREKKNGYH